MLLTDYKSHNIFASIILVIYFSGKFKGSIFSSTSSLMEWKKLSNSLYFIIFLFIFN